VGHHLVAGHSHPVYLLQINLLAVAQLRQEAVDGLDHQTLEVLQPVFLLLGVDDAGDDVLATRSLTVVGRSDVHHLAAQQVHQVDDVGGGADIHGDAQGAIGAIAGHEVNQAGRDMVPVPYVEHRCHLPIRLAQRGCYPPEQWEVDGDVVYPILFGQFSFQPFEVAGLVGQAGGLDVEEELADGGFPSPVALDGQGDLFGRLLNRDHALDFQCGGNEDDHIALDNRLAGLDVALFQFFGREIDRGRLINCSVLDQNLAAAAASLPTAGDRDFQIGFSGGVYQDSADLNLHRFSRGLKSDNTLAHRSPLSYQKKIGRGSGNQEPRP